MQSLLESCIPAERRSISSVPAVGLRQPPARRASLQGPSHLQSSHRGSLAQVIILLEFITNGGLI